MQSRISRLKMKKRGTEAQSVTEVLGYPQPDMLQQPTPYKYGVRLSNFGCYEDS